MTAIVSTTAMCDTKPRHPVWPSARATASGGRLVTHSMAAMLDQITKITKLIIFIIIKVVNTSKILFKIHVLRIRISQALLENY